MPPTNPPPRPSFFFLFTKLKPFPFDERRSSFLNIETKKSCVGQGKAINNVWGGGCEQKENNNTNAEG